jgi:hypothetical protein
VVVVDGRQALVSDAAGLIRVVEGDSPQPAVSVHIERFAVICPVGRLEEDFVELGDDRVRAGCRVEHVEAARLAGRQGPANGGGGALRGCGSCGHL